MLKTTKNWLLLEDKDEAPHVQGPWITIKKTASLVLNTLHHFQLHPHQDLASHEGGEILLEEHGVGGITVCYGTCLWSLVLWARAYHCDCIIILAFHSTYETQQGYWWSWNFGLLKCSKTRRSCLIKFKSILAILTVLFTFLYLLWGPRTG